MDGIFLGRFPGRFLRDDGYRTATANERRILSLLRRDGSQSRADLVRKTGLKAHSITRLVEPLVERGLIIEQAPEAKGRGKPSTPLRLNGEAAFSVGLSIMTDAVALVLLDFAGDVRFFVREPLREKELDAAIGQLRELIARSVHDAGLDPALMVGVGVGVTGYFVDRTARMNPPALLEPWALVPLDEVLADGLGQAVWIDNDGNVAAVGEALFGQGRHATNFAYLYFSAGFGGGIVVNGKPARGNIGNAGEFAAILPFDWPQPNLERLRAMMNEAGGSYADLNALLDDFAVDLPGVSRWLDDSEGSLNLVVSAISAVLDPELIVLGGRMPKALAEAIIPRLRYTNPPRRDLPRPVPAVVASAVAEDAVALGAATMPLRAAFFEY